MAKKNVYLSVFVLVASIILIEIFNRTRPKHPNADLNIKQLVDKYGYPLETHEVVSDDGYILTLHRIPHGREKLPGKRTPVLLMHGFMQSGIDFVNLGPKNALSFLLVEKGYDVWLGNVRGTTSSKRHKILNPDKDKAFWDYSLHEIALYDVPAFIDHILNITSEESLHYIGYSQGTSVFFVLGSEKPEYMEKVRLMTALAPAIYTKDPASPILSNPGNLKKMLQFAFDIFSIWNIAHDDGFIPAYMKFICNENSLFVNLCFHQISILQGYNHEEMNKTELSLIYSNTPNGCSAKQLIHIMQLLESGNFQQYDLGTSENLKRYGQPEPPHYNLSKIKVPVALYYSSNDWAINEKNMEKVVKAVPNVVKSYRVPLKTFNHNDFINAKNVVSLLYDTVIEEIVKY